MGFFQELGKILKIISPIKGKPVDWLPGLIVASQGDYVKAKEYIEGMLQAKYIAMLDELEASVASNPEAVHSLFFQFKMKIKSLQL